VAGAAGGLAGAVLTSPADARARAMSKNEPLISSIITAFVFGNATSGVRWGSVGKLRGK
jgi:hypothetical protein